MSRYLCSLPDYYSWFAGRPEVHQCAEEQTRVGDEIRAGGRDYGLMLGAQDWLKEEAILHGRIKDKHTE